MRICTNSYCVAKILFVTQSNFVCREIAEVLCFASDVNPALGSLPVLPRSGIRDAGLQVIPVCTPEYQVMKNGLIRLWDIILHLAHFLRVIKKLFAAALDSIIKINIHAQKDRV